jgi:hypothetical protein
VRACVAEDKNLAVLACAAVRSLACVSARACRASDLKVLCLSVKMDVRVLLGFMDGLECVCG